nr:ankyrin repeat-containing protein NPR4-like [Ipomoea batatas]
MVFTEEHKELKEGGEKWMKDTANSCTIAAALIVTVVFAAAITVPGGNSGENGLPIFSNNNAFTVFSISNAASLFTSATSLLVFLSILTSRYAEEDFLYALPKRLIIGLFTLFLSIIFMMIAFSSTVYLVFGHNRRGVLIIEDLYRTPREAEAVGDLELGFNSTNENLHFVQGFNSTNENLHYIPSGS